MDWYQMGYFESEKHARKSILLHKGLAEGFFSRFIYSFRSELRLRWMGYVVVLVDIGESRLAEMETATPEFKSSFFSFISNFKTHAPTKYQTTNHEHLQLLMR
jgi:hypothetical protein